MNVSFLAALLVLATSIIKSTQYDGYYSSGLLEQPSKIFTGSFYVLLSCKIIIIVLARIVFTQEEVQ